MWVKREWRHDAKKRGQLSEPEQAEDQDVSRGWPAGARDRRGPECAGDASRADGRSEGAGSPAPRPTWWKASSSCGDAWTWAASGSTRRRARTLVREMHGYVWDERWAKIGEDRPVKHDDHGCDALRYAVHTGAGLPSPAPVILTR